MTHNPSQPTGKKSKKSGSAYHHGDLRDALIRAGVELLKEGGVQNLSLREAARAAGVTQAAPYRHFENKEALVAAICQEGFNLQRHEVRGAVLSLPGNPFEQLQRAAQAYLKMALSYPEYFKLMFAGTPVLSVKRYPDIGQATHFLLHEFIEVIRLCQREQIVRGGSPEQLALIFWSSVHGYTSLILSRSVDALYMHDHEAELAMRAHVTAVLEGLKPPSRDRV